MTLPAVLSPEAEADLDDAAAWHERQSHGLGAELVSEVRNALLRVGDQPEGYPELRPGVRRAHVRRFSYGIFYRVRADRVEVIGIFHDRRSPRVWQRRARGG
jgi:plasmid stabilization system protein ParE